MVFGLIFLSIPFYFLWNYLAPIYLPQLPLVYLHIPFWHCVGIFALLAILKSVLTCGGHCYPWKKKD